MSFQIAGPSFGIIGGGNINISNLLSLISAIPIAKDGDIITPDYHNSLRAALLALASKAGATPGAQTLTLTFPPQFSENAGGPNWNMVNGAASVLPGATDANGWFPVLAPHGARIQNVVAFGNRSGDVASFTVELVRQTIEGGSTVSLVSMQLNNAASPFKIPGTVNVTGAGPAALEEYRGIDNEHYSYFVVANAINASAPSVAQITSIQLIFSLV